MKMKWVRDQLAGGSLFTQADFEGALRCSRREVRGKHWGWLSLTFTTPSTGNVFDGAIESEQFEDLAREMMRADATAAVRAFGKVLQELSNVPDLAT